MKKSLIIFLVLLITFEMCTSVSAYDKSKYAAVYRVYNSSTGEHLYTTAFGEAWKLQNDYGWTIEGVLWYSPPHKNKVYRLYNPQIGEHLYTMDLNEINTITYPNGNWLIDNNGNACFWSGGSLPVYRLYLPETGRHLLTPDENEYQTLPQYGWRQEGIVFYGIAPSEVK